MFTWKKLGKVFDPTLVVGKKWIKEFAQAPSVVIFDGFVRIYFSCRPPADEKGQYVSYSAFVDVDRKNLLSVIKISDDPILTLGKLGTFDEFGTYPVSVIKFQDEYRAYYAGWTRCESVPFNVAIGFAVSKDNGVSFQRTGDGPILSYSIDEPFILSGPKVRRFNDKWYLFYIAGKNWVLDNGKPEPVYTIRMATSEDGFSWKKENRELIKSKVEANEAQASPDVIYFNDQYHMFFCYRYSTNYRTSENGYRIGYANSRDLINWKREDEQAGIKISEDGGWDSESISYPHVFKLDDKIYMLYLGNQVGKYGFGLAELEDYKQ